MMTSVSVVGLNSETNGRSCGAHSVCGLSATVGMTVCFEKTTARIGRKMEPALAVVINANGQKKCRIGFVPKSESARFDQLDNKTAVITDIGSLSRESGYKQMGEGKVKLM